MSAAAKPAAEKRAAFIGRSLASHLSHIANHHLTEASSQLDELYYCGDEINTNNKWVFDFIDRVPRSCQNVMVVNNNLQLNDVEAIVSETYRNEKKYDLIVLDWSTLAFLTDESRSPESYRFNNFGCLCSSAIFHDSDCKAKSYCRKVGRRTPYPLVENSFFIFVSYHLQKNGVVIMHDVRDEAPFEFDLSSLSNSSTATGTKIKVDWKGDWWHNHRNIQSVICAPFSRMKCGHIKSFLISIGLVDPLVYKSTIGFINADGQMVDFNDDANFNPNTMMVRVQQIFNAPQHIHQIIDSFTMLQMRPVAVEKIRGDDESVFYYNSRAQTRIIYKIKFDSAAAVAKMPATAYSTATAEAINKVDKDKTDHPVLTLIPYISEGEQPGGKNSWSTSTPTLCLQLCVEEDNIAVDEETIYNFYIAAREREVDGNNSHTVQVCLGRNKTTQIQWNNISRSLCDVGMTREGNTKVTAWMKMKKRADEHNVHLNGTKVMTPPGEKIEVNDGSIIALFGKTGYAYQVQIVNRSDRKRGSDDVAMKDMSDDSDESEIEEQGKEEAQYDENETKKRKRH